MTPADRALRVVTALESAEAPREQALRLIAEAIEEAVRDADRAAVQHCPEGRKRTHVLLRSLRGPLVATVEAGSLVR